MRVAVFMWLFFGLVGCASEGSRLSLTLAPLELEGIDFACYDIEIRSGGGIVMRAGDARRSLLEGDSPLCSDRYGGGANGAISYISSCDADPTADLDPDRPGIQNELTLWFDGLYVAGPEAVRGAWQDPCGDDGCRFLFDCEENSDTQLELDFTVMRQGNGGFFDLVVAFESIFCAAKVDCRYAGEGGEVGDVIRLFGAPEGGPKWPTVVFAVSCSAGKSGEEATRLYMSDLEIRCEDAPFVLPIPTDTPGPIYETSPNDFVAQALIDQGYNDLVGHDEIFWTAAVAMRPEATEPPYDWERLRGKGCELRAQATAAAGDITPTLLASQTSYPYLDAVVPLTDDEGQLVCGQHPINGGPAFRTRYAPLGQLPGGIQWELRSLDGVSAEAQTFTLP